MQASFLIGPHKTPKMVKILIWITAAVSILAPILTYFFMNYFQLSGPIQWLSLSLAGIKKGWIWQPLTYFFINSYSTTLPLSLFISLFFQMFILWFAASEINFRFGSLPFLFFYLSSAIFAGLVSLLLLFAFSSSEVLFGSGPPIYACVMIFAMIYPNLDLFFFFFFKVKAKWLIAILLGFVLLISLVYGQFISFAAQLSAILWAFAIGRLFWKLPNPYPLNFSFFSKNKKNSSDKIIDISVFQEDDDSFMDRMLEKISKEGESSLTKKEKERMQKISQKKR